MPTFVPRAPTIAARPGTRYTGGAASAAICASALCARRMSPTALAASKKADWAVHGGERVMVGDYRNAFYVSPALVEASEQSGPMEEETFAPILYVKRYRDLDEAIQALTASGPFDQLQLTRLKKKKLMLRDQITKLEDQIVPDIIA